jgi:hypothetical protein
MMDIQELTSDKRFLPIILVLVLIVILVIVTVTSPPPEEPSIVSAEPKTDDEIYTESVIAGDATGCDMIEDADKKALCKSMADDISAYTAALEAKDTDLCLAIEENEFQKACVEAITTSITL